MTTDEIRLDKIRISQMNRAIPVRAAHDFDKNMRALGGLKRGQI